MTQALHGRVKDALLGEHGPDERMSGLVILVGVNQGTAEGDQSVIQVKRCNFYPKFLQGLIPPSEDIVYRKVGARMHNQNTHSNASPPLTRSREAGSSQATARYTYLIRPGRGSLPRQPGLTRKVCEETLVATSDDTECWLPVPDYEGFYEVSSLAQVRSIRHMTTAGWRGGKVLKPFLDGDGYFRVSLSRYGVVRSVPVHVLVLRAFKGDPEPGQQSRHGPNGILDNRPGELSWGTGQENSDDKYRDGTMACGERQGNARLRAADIIAIRTQAAAGRKQVRLAQEYGVSQAHISRIVLRESWAHIS